MTLPFIPEEVLTDVFEHLSFDDVKSCRLTCERWNQCCLRNSVADKGKLILRYRIYTADEMNVWLTDIKRSRINVEFVGVKLEELDFEAFGGKVRHLEITNCSIDDESTIMNVFTFTPHMKSFTFKHPDRDILGRTLLTLGENEQFSNPHFKCLDCPFSVIELDTNLRRMFPRLSEIFCCKLDMGLEGSVEKRPESLLTLPKLTTMWTNIALCTVEEDSVRVVCLEFFSKLTRLERITLNVNVGVRSDDEGAPERVQRFYQELLYVLLSSSRKLRKCALHVNGTYPLSENKRRLEPALYLRTDMYQEFLQLISRLELLDTYPINGDIPPFREALVRTRYSGVAKNLKMLVLVRTFNGPQDLRHVLLELCLDLELLDVCVDVRRLNVSNYTGTRITHIGLAYLVHVQRDLNSLTITFRADENELDEDIEASSFRNLVIPHRKLSHLRLNFPNPFVHSLFRQLYPFETMWNFPNLSTLQISYQSARKCSTLESPFALIDAIVNWVMGMSAGLRTIKLPHQRRFCIGIEEIEKICKAKTKLVRIAWSSWGCPNVQRIVSIFVSCPNLKLVNIYVHSIDDSNDEAPETVQFYYSRSAECLYKSAILRITSAHQPSSLFTQA